MPGGYCAMFFVDCSVPVCSGLLEAQRGEAEVSIMQQGQQPKENFMHQYGNLSRGFVWMTLSAALIIGGCASAPKTTSDSGGAPSSKPESTPTSKIESPVMKEIATLETTMGTIEIELYRDDAPKTVENFVKLAGEKYYDGVIFHRVAKGFVIQGGDPTGAGSGGKSIYGQPFEDELNPSTQSYKAGYLHGVVAMANRGPNTNTSQFFIMLKDVPRMPKNYTIFGKVIKGLDVVDKIGDVEINPSMGPTDGRPKVDVRMTSVTVQKRAATEK
jgi:cyclophilin family peptidyl-prolyl cis-trans isomerase